MKESEEVLAITRRSETIPFSAEVLKMSHPICGDIKQKGSCSYIDSNRIHPEAGSLLIDREQHMNNVEDGEKKTKGRTRKKGEKEKKKRRERKKRAKAEAKDRDSKEKDAKDKHKEENPRKKRERKEQELEKKDEKEEIKNQPVPSSVTHGLENTLTWETSTYDSKYRHEYKDFGQIRSPDISLNSSLRPSESFIQDSTTLEPTSSREEEQMILSVVHPKEQEQAILDVFDPEKEEQAARNASQMYSRLPIKYPRELQGATQETQIRLIELMPKFMGDSLFCNMSCTALDKKTRFIALSYAWGNTTKTHRIYVKGYEILVTKNLHDALMQLRKVHDSVVLWVDALCIDQSNLQERNYQVRQMPKIYRAAQEVIAWLGQRTYASDQAMELITLSPEDLRRRKEFDIQEYLNDLFSRPYWSRVWVVQELASANQARRACTLRCGYKSVTLYQFKVFLGHVLRQIHISKLKDATRPRNLVSLSMQDPNRTFLDVLWQSSSLLASDERDRIYGIRGISPKFYRGVIEVDYSISYEKLCSKVMAFIVRKERSLNILCYFHRYAFESKFPSWSCDFEKDKPPSWLLDFKNRNEGISPKIYSCDKGRKANAKIANGILRTRGICIGRVQEFKPFTKTTREDKFWKPKTNLRHESELDAIKNLSLDAFKTRYHDASEEARDDRFLEMFAGGKEQARKHIGKDYRKKWCHIWDRRIAFEKGTASSFEWDTLDSSFCSAFARLVGRCVFTTSERNLGLGPRDMRKNDLVCIIYGSRLPLILRKSERFYSFIGPAYVDGVMNGERIEDGEKGRRFWIR